MAHSAKSPSLSHDKVHFNRRQRWKNVNLSANSTHVAKSGPSSSPLQANPSTLTRKDDSEPTRPLRTSSQPAIGHSLLHLLASPPPVTQPTIQARVPLPTTKLMSQFWEENLQMTDEVMAEIERADYLQTLNQQHAAPETQHDGGTRNGAEKPSAGPPKNWPIRDWPIREVSPFPSERQRTRSLPTVIQVRYQTMNVQPDDQRHLLPSLSAVNRTLQAKRTTSLSVQLPHNVLQLPSSDLLIPRLSGEDVQESWTLPSQPLRAVSKLIVPQPLSQRHLVPDSQPRIHAQVLLKHPRPIGRITPAFLASFTEKHPAEGKTEMDRAGYPHAPIQQSAAAGIAGDAYAGSTHTDSVYVEEVPVTHKDSVELRLGREHGTALDANTTWVFARRTARRSNEGNERKPQQRDSTPVQSRASHSNLGNSSPYLPQGQYQTQGVPLDRIYPDIQDSSGGDNTSAKVLSPKREAYHSSSRVQMFTNSLVLPPLHVTRAKTRTPDRSLPLHEESEDDVTASLKNGVGRPRDHDSPAAHAHLSPSGARAEFRSVSSHFNHRFAVDSTRATRQNRELPPLAKRVNTEPTESFNGTQLDRRNYSESPARSTRPNALAPQHPPTSVLPPSNAASPGLIPHVRHSSYPAPGFPDTTYNSWGQTSKAFSGHQPDPTRVPSDSPSQVQSLYPFIEDEHGPSTRLASPLCTNAQPYVENNRADGSQSFSQQSSGTSGVGYTYTPSNDYVRHRVRAREHSIAIDVDTPVPDYVTVHSQQSRNPRHGVPPSGLPHSYPTVSLVEAQDELSAFDIQCLPPPDLTSCIVKIQDQYMVAGSFGDVYKCRYHGGSEPIEVAVKAFRFNFTLEGDTEDKSLKMLRRELGIWRRLKHGNIVPFLGIAYGFGMYGAMSLVSLWMPNESLHRFLIKYDSNLGVVHRLLFLLDIVNGLHYLHSFSIIHGDLNCNNVLLDADFTARLADFGYASLIGNIPDAFQYLQRSTARPGALRWNAPEQINPETFNWTTKSDIYSFGCVALQVLSSKLPWSEVQRDAAVVLHLALGHKPGRPTSRPIEDSHWNLIQQCFSSIEERPATHVIMRCIRQFLDDCPPSQLLRNLLTSLDNGADSDGG